jgi:hypothetical protein
MFLCCCEKCGIVKQFLKCNVPDGKHIRRWPGTLQLCISTGSMEWSYRPHTHVAAISHQYIFDAQLSGHCLLNTKPRASQITTQPSLLTCHSQRKTVVCNSVTYSVSGNNIHVIENKIFLSISWAFNLTRPVFCHKLYFKSTFYVSLSMREVIAEYCIGIIKIAYCNVRFVSVQVCLSVSKCS